MIYLMFLCFWMSVCSASQKDRELEINLSKMIKEDNNQLVRNFTTHQQVEQKKRELNGGMLPLSLPVKDQIKNSLWYHFDQEHEAIYFFKTLAVKHSLYPLSVEKMIIMIQSEYRLSPVVDFESQLQIVRAKVSPDIDKIKLEVSQLENRSAYLSKKLDELRLKIQERKAEKTQAAIHPFRLPPLNSASLSTDLSNEENS